MFESSTPQPPSPVPPPRPTEQAPAPPPPWQPRRRPWWKRALSVVGVLIFLGSLVMNLYLLLLLSLLVAGDLETSIMTPGRSDQIVAVWRIDGLIGQEQANLAEKFCRKVRADPNIQAVVLRVDSGGGHIAPCDRIYQSLRQLRDSGKKVVVSMGGVAASGGYYVSLPGETIFAEPTTVTGSIGVISFLPVFTGTMDKYGLKMVVVRSKRTQAWKAAPNPFENPADYQLAELQNVLDAMQQTFEDAVRAGRAGKLKVTEARREYVGADGKKFTVDEVEPFNGKIFLAERAGALGLVDKVGYLQDAIAQAGRLAGLTKPKVVVYSRRKSFLEGMLTHVGLGPRGWPVELKMPAEVQSPKIMMVWQVGR